MSRPWMIFQGLNKTYDEDNNNPDGKRLSSYTERRTRISTPPAKYTNEMRVLHYTLEKPLNKLFKNYTL